MPTPLEQTIAIILDPQSRIRETNPLVYEMPKDKMADHETRMRYFDLPDGDLSKSMRRWMITEYGDSVLQKEPIEDDQDQSPIFAVIREPQERWWGGVREWMTNLPWYSWWENEQIMQYFPHFNRFTMNMDTTLKKVKVTHFIKGDKDLPERFANFCRKHRLRQYGKLPMVPNLSDADTNRKNMQDVGVQQLKKWLRKNPDYKKKLDDYLAHDYKYWNKVEDQT